MTLSPGVRKLGLAVHLTFSVGWMGAVLGYLVLAIAAATGVDEETVRGAWIAMALTGWYAVVPLALGSLATGVVMALGTKWGLIRHYWVMFSLVLTVFAVAVLLLHMPDVSATAQTARMAATGNLDALGADIVHPGIGLVLLLVIHVLNVYKPRGMTRYGRRKDRDERRRADEGRQTPSRQSPQAHGRDSGPKASRRHG